MSAFKKKPIPEDRIKLTNKAIQKAMKDSCPYCSDLDTKYSYGWLEGKGHLQIIEEHIDDIVHPDIPSTYKEFRALVCMNCGFARLFFTHPS